MSRFAPILPAVAVMLGAVVSTASPADASKSCPPISVGAGDTCECTVFNYNTSPDGNIRIKVYRGIDGVVETCGVGGSIRGEGRVVCPVVFRDPDTCGCQVTGEGGSARVSIAVVRESFAEVPDGGTSARAAMGCTK
jgi:hypothetical protein